MEKFSEPTSAMFSKLNIYSWDIYIYIYSSIKPAFVLLGLIKNMTKDIINNKEMSNDYITKIFKKNNLILVI